MYQRYGCLHLKVIADPLKFYAAYGDKDENSVLRAKVAAAQTKEDHPAPLEATEVHMSHFDALQLKSSVTHFPSLFGQECSDRC